MKKRKKEYYNGYELPELPEMIILDEADCRCVATAHVLGDEMDVRLEQCKDGMKCSTGLRWYQVLSSRFSKKYFMVFQQPG